ncbi:MAG: hypothetical protein ACC645_01370 [Pirellulales bacterium]
MAVPLAVVSVAMAVDATPDGEWFDMGPVAAADVTVGPGVAVAVGSSGIWGVADRAIDDVSGESEPLLFHQAKLGQAPLLRQPGMHARKMAKKSE